MPRSKRLPLSEDQIQRLYWDTYAYHTAAKSLNEEIRRRNLPLASPQEISLNSAATVNLGFSLELLMKYLYALSRVNYPSGFKGHSLSYLYQEMPDDPKTEMSCVYDQYSQDNINPSIFRATLWNPIEPRDPPVFDLQTFESFLTYLDEIGTYSRRYSFESYARSEWTIRVDVDWLAGLIEKFVSSANNYRKQRPIK